MGQRIKQFSLEAEIDGKWETIDNQTTIGYKRILRLEDVKATKVRLNIEAAKGCPLISNIAIYNAPLIIDVPKINRNKQGKVTLQTPEKGVEVFYTLNSSAPTRSSSKYTDTFIVHQPTTLKAFSFDPKTKRKSDVITKNFDISKNHWKITTLQDAPLTEQAIDDNPSTDWLANKHMLSNYKIDLGTTTTIKGFTYTPTQGRWASGIITHYSFYGSTDGKHWMKLSQGEFSNIIANPIQQKVLFPKATSVKYIKLIADKIMDNKDKALIAEIGIITE